MNGKQLLTIILLASLSITLIFSMLAGIYKYKPDWLGYPPLPGDTVKVVKKDTVYLEPTVQITEKRLAELNRDVAQKQIFQTEKDSLYAKNKRIVDSLNIYKNKIAFYLDSISRVQKVLGNTKGFGNNLQDSIKKLVSKFKDAQDKLKIAEQRASDQEKFISTKQDTLEKKSFQDFAKIYNNANPKDVAKILEQLDERDAAHILKLMSKKKAGKIIESMKPQKAAAILLLGDSE
ncbi:MAG: hypothetical protein NTW25_06530 [Candidatus Kapabacteria bacterium]|jgi:flagellar motility protein MotE (MotC chaperone)|nr:hypothetical protein [Candidatus Kapabacteria bacterium]